MIKLLFFDYPQDEKTKLKAFYITVFKIDTETKSKETFAQSIIPALDLINSPEEVIPISCLFDGKSILTAFVTIKHSIDDVDLNDFQLNLQNAWVESRFVEQGNNIKVDVFLDGSDHQPTPVTKLAENTIFSTSHVFSYHPKPENTINVNFIVSKYDSLGQEQILGESKIPVSEISCNSGEIFQIDIKDQSKKQAVRLFLEAFLSVPEIQPPKVEVENKILELLIQKGFVHSSLVEDNKLLKVDLSLDGTAIQSIQLNLTPNPVFNSNFFFSFHHTDEKPVNLFILVSKVDSESQEQQTIAFSKITLSELEIDSYFLLPIESIGSEVTKPEVSLILKAILVDAQLLIDSSIENIQEKPLSQRSSAYNLNLRRPQNLLSPKGSATWKVPIAQSPSSPRSPHSPLPSLNNAQT